MTVKHFKNVAAGLVLIELLMATAIAALLIAVVLAVYASILNTVAIQSHWREKTLPAADALEIISRDLACLAVPFGITNPPFSAAWSTNSAEIFGMNFYRAFSTASTNDRRSYSLSHVNYSLQTVGGTEGLILVRESRPFRVPSRNPSAAGRERWRGIRQLAITFFDGSAWTNQWGTGKGSNAIPKAVRIELTSGQNNPRKLRAEVFINAGNQIVPARPKQLP